MVLRNVTGLVLALGFLAACGGDDTGTASSSSSEASSSSSSSGAGGGSSGSSSSGSSSSGSSSGSGGAGPTCTAARDAALVPINIVSTGDVKELSKAGATQMLYIDASAGGIMAQKQNPWIYLSLKTGTKVAVTDPASFTSTDWDLAIKRPLLRTNSGDGGPGKGGAVLLDGKAFVDVTAADAMKASIKPEAWFDSMCNLNMDPTGAIATTFSGWYDYDQATNKVTPHAATFVVRGADGALYKLAVLDYYANPDGTSGMTSGHYKIEVAKLP